MEITGAEIFHENEILGAGVRVGIIDTGFEDYEMLQEDGELPEDIEVEGLLAYTGELPRDARDAARGFEPNIVFKRF